MSAWAALQRELDAWAEAGRSATLWWRDDDAEAPGPALERLLALAARHEVAPALAVVPAGAGRPLGDRLGACPDVFVLCHGLTHRNLAPGDARKSEFGAGRPVREMLADVAAGWHCLRQLFGAQALPVLVPPWNRVAPALLPRLPDAGIRGLSTLGARAAAEPAPGLLQVNCHVDLVDWRGGRCFVGEAAALEALRAHFVGRRDGRYEAAEPSGIMSHHLVHDAEAWDFLERLLETTRRHPATHWLSAAEAFNLAP